MDWDRLMVVFVAGVHGVGKTYLCERFAAETGIIHSSASSLIEGELKSANWKSNKLVSDIESNQIALKKAVNRLNANNSKLLIDGHFVLRDSTGILVNITEDIFKDLALSAIVLIECPSKTVSERLLTRDKNTSTGDISEFLEAEKKRATYISTTLSIPLLILNQPSTQFFQEKINTLFKSH
jgi:adenylate kinase